MSYIKKEKMDISINSTDQNGNVKMLKKYVLKLSTLKLFN